MPRDTTKTEANDAASEQPVSAANRQSVQPDPVTLSGAPQQEEQKEPQVPQPGAAQNTIVPPPSKPSALSALPPLPSPIYARIPPRAPMPRPSSAKKPLPPLGDTTRLPPQPLPKKDAIVLETPKPTDAGGQGFTGTDVGLTTHIAEILKEAHMPERRDAKAATGAPALQETSLTDAPYRSTIQLDAAPPGTDVPSAVELSRTQNKLVMPGEVIEQPFTKGAVVSLHTMKTDLQSAAINKKLTIVRAASMEAQKRAAAGEVPTLATKKPGGFRSSLFLVVTILVLVALGGAALYAVYYLKVKPVTQGPVGVGILFAEQQLALPIDGQSAANVKQSIERVMSQGGANGTIVEIVPTTQGGDSSAPVRPATTGEFLRALGAHPTDEFVRSLSDQFFFGIHFADSPSPVFVIPVVSYDNAFAGMLAWEKTIDIELGGIFVQLPLYRASAVKALIASTTAPEATSTATTFATTTATSTKTGQGTTTKVVASTTSIVAPSTAANPTMNELSPPRTFKDLVMKNYDVRALKDDNDGIVLYYSFPPTQNLLIISASPYSFPEIISRLQAARRL